MHLNLEFSPEFLSVIREAVRIEVESVYSRQMETNLKQLLTIGEVAEFMQVSVNSVRHFMNIGLPHFKEGQVIRFIKSDVIEWTKKDHKKK